MQRQVIFSVMTMHIRVANATDAPALRDLAIRTFRDAFGADNRPEDLELYLDAAYSAAQISRDLANPDVITFVAEFEQRLEAFAQLRRGKLPPTGTMDAPIELWRFYVDKAHHGQGLAAALMNHVTVHAINLGARTLWLGVWERNPRGIAFYNKVGFTDVGSYVFVLGNDPQADRVMVRSLGAPPR